MSDRGKEAVWPYSKKGQYMSMLNEVTEVQLADT